jgi:gas vesicle protein
VKAHITLLNVRNFKDYRFSRNGKKLRNDSFVLIACARDTTFKPALHQHARYAQENINTMLHLDKEAHTEDKHTINKSKKVLTSMIKSNITDLTDESRRKINISTQEATDTAVVVHTTR